MGVMERWHVKDTVWASGQCNTLEAEWSNFRVNDEATRVCGKSEDAYLLLTAFFSHQFVCLAGNLLRYMIMLFNATFASLNIFAYLSASTPVQVGQLLGYPGLM